MITEHFPHIPLLLFDDMTLGTMHSGNITILCIQEIVSCYVIVCSLTPVKHTAVYNVMFVRSTT